MSKTLRVVRKLDEAAAALAADIIRGGGVVAVPTDTVYGLACDATSRSAVRRLYAIKRRHEAKPIAISLDRLAELARWAHTEALPPRLLPDLLPGPVTVILDRTPLLDNPLLNPGSGGVGVRIPDSGFVREVTKRFGGPVALTSANLSSIPSSVAVREFEPLFSELDAVFDAGPLNDGAASSRLGSTVVDLRSRGVYTVVRKGVGYEATIATLAKHGLTCVNQ